MGKIDFRKILFGMSDAQSEGRRFPRLLTDGYLDSMGVVQKALNAGIFLFLGYKGSGKSALSEHLRLSNVGKNEIIINDIMMKSFPYKLFAKIIKGDAEQEAKFPLAWQWILLLYVLNSFNNDCSLNHDNIDDWHNTISELRKAQLFPIVSISDIVNRSSKQTLKVNLKLIESTQETISNTDFNPYTLIEHIKDMLCRVTTSNRHYLIIDGLDDFLSNRVEQLRSVVALINESKDLNDWFTENDIPFKIIILCRTDVFDHLSDPNKNKIRIDYSYSLNWFDESETDNYKKSKLIELANLRGRLIYPNISDIFYEFFPKEYDRMPIYNALLEYTRHTPRDFLQLLNMIQSCCNSEKVSSSAISSGIKKYSLEYFQGEIRDELAGYLSTIEIDSIFQLLSQLRKREFKLTDIKRLADNNNKYKNIDFTHIFNVMFECSAIGHLKGADNKHYIKYRNRSMTFSEIDTIIIHKGLWKALVV